VFTLAKLLELSHRILFIGVGNVLKRDDGVGVVISQGIRKRPGVLTLTVEVSIENYIGKINSLEPGVIVIVDCMELGSSPGTYRLMELENVEDITFNTHNISLGKLGDFFLFPTYVLGVQPQDVSFGDELSPPVKAAAQEILNKINQKSR
jgi:hydrogenase maturation protease